MRISRTGLPKSSTGLGLTKITGHCEICHRRHASNTINGRLVCLRKRWIQRASIHLSPWMNLMLPILFGLALTALRLPETKWLLFAAGITLHDTTTTKLKTIKPKAHCNAKSSVSPQTETKHVIRRRDFLKNVGLRAAWSPHRSKSAFCLGRYAGPNKDDHRVRCIIRDFCRRGRRKQNQSQECRNGSNHLFRHRWRACHADIHRLVANRRRDLHATGYLRLVDCSNSSPRSSKLVEHRW